MQILVDKSLDDYLELAKAHGGAQSEQENMTMTAFSKDDVRSVLADLTGHKAPLDTPVPDASVALLTSGGSGLGYSQLNELLLLLGYDRITTSFFQYLVDEGLEYKAGSTIESFEQLASGVCRFRKISVLISMGDGPVTECGIEADLIHGFRITGPRVELWC